MFIVGIFVGVIFEKTCIGYILFFMHIFQSRHIDFLPEEAEMEGMLTKLFRFKILKIRFG
jgi:hypothetical protein